MRDAVKPTRKCRRSERSILAAKWAAVDRANLRALARQIVALWAPPAGPLPEPDRADARKDGTH
jgi:hypothetical protein